MGMLLRQYHDQPDGTRKPGDEAGQDKPLDRRNKAELQAEAEQRGLSTEGSRRELLERIKAHDAEPPAEPSPYADLTDEQLAEAYATNVDADGDYPGRDAAVEALTALDADNS